MADIRDRGDLFRRRRFLRELASGGVEEAEFLQAIKGKGGWRALTDVKNNLSKRFDVSTVEKLVDAARDDFGLAEFPDAGAFLFDLPRAEGRETCGCPHRALSDSVRADLDHSNRVSEYVGPRGYLINDMLRKAGERLDARNAADGGPVRVVAVDFRGVGSNPCGFWGKVYAALAPGGAACPYRDEADADRALDELRKLLKEESRSRPVALVLRNVDNPVRDMLVRGGDPGANREAVRTLKAQVCGLKDCGRVAVVVFGTYDLRNYCTHVHAAGDDQPKVASPFDVSPRDFPPCDNWADWSARRVEELVPRPSDPEGLVDMIDACEEHPKALLDGLKVIGRGGAEAALGAVRAEHERVARSLYDLGSAGLQEFLSGRGWERPDRSNVAYITVLKKAHVLVAAPAAGAAGRPESALRPRVRAWAPVWAVLGGAC